MGGINYYKLIINCFSLQHYIATKKDKFLAVFMIDVLAVVFSNLMAYALA
jgi:hypothetical protein